MEVRGEEISQLLFADDTLVFYEPNEKQLTYLCGMFMWFEALSFLKINLEKREIIPMGSIESTEVLAQEFGCKVGALPSSSSSLPLGAPFKYVSIWDDVE